MKQVSGASKIRCKDCRTSDIHWHIMESEKCGFCSSGNLPSVTVESKSMRIEGDYIKFTVIGFCRTCRKEVARVNIKHKLEKTNLKLLDVEVVENILNEDLMNKFRGCGDIYSIDDVLNKYVLGDGDFEDDNGVGIDSISAMEFALESPEVARQQVEKMKERVKEIHYLSGIIKQLKKDMGKE